MLPDRDDLSYSVDTITAGVIQNLDYTLDDAGNITAIANLIDSSKNRTFSYDDLYRLTGVNGETKYNYDKIGNRQCCQEGSSDLLGNDANELNQYQQPDRSSSQPA